MAARPGVRGWVGYSRYGRLWTAAVGVAAAGWSLVAVLQSPRGPLSVFVLVLSSYGGLLSAPSPRPSTRALRGFATGMAGTALLVLVVVGIGHHVVTGLVLVAALAATSPGCLRHLSERWGRGPDSSPHR